MAVDTCPRCGSADRREILYGLPTSESFERARRGELELAGCILTESIPAWRCKACGEAYGEDASSRALLDLAMASAPERARRVELARVEKAAREERRRILKARARGKTE